MKSRSWTAARTPLFTCFRAQGLKSKRAAKKFIRIKQPIRVEDGDKWAELLPHDGGFQIDFAIDFDHPAIADTNQAMRLDFNTNSFVKHISRARTFGFMKDIEQLRAHNLALGGSFDNAVVLDEFRILNSEGLRYDDEFVKHKILDAIGDLYMCGYALLGHLRAYKSGHAVNNMLIRAVLENQHAWEFVTFEQAKAKSPIAFGNSIPARAL